MSSIEHPKNFSHKLLEKLGVTNKNVNQIQITVKPNDIILINVSMIMTTEVSDFINEELQQYIMEPCSAQKE